MSGVIPSGGNGDTPTPAQTTSAAPPPPSSAPATGGAGMSESQWASLVLQDLGAPQTQNNIDNIMRWMTAEEPTNNWFDRNNPLNASLGNGSVDGTGSYVSLEEGARYTALMISQSNMSGIHQALMSDAPPSEFSRAVVASPWASSHYGGNPNHIADIAVPGGNVVGGTSIPNGGGGGDIGAASNPIGGSTTTGPQLSMNDIPAVDQYIRQNWGSDAWLLDIPEVKSVLENAAVQGLSPTQVQAEIEQTSWWQSTSAAVRQYEQDAATNPADYSFSTPGSKAQQALAIVQSTAGQYGVNLNNDQAQTIALNSLKYGWTSQETRIAIAATINGGAQQNSAPAVYKQLQAAAGQYLMNVSDPTLKTWAQNIAAGTQTIDQFNAYLAQNASVKWSGMAGMIQQGMTPNQIVDSYRQEAAKVMEVDPNSIDFVNNPIYSKILDYVPPTPGGNTPMTPGMPNIGAGAPNGTTVNPTDSQHRMMTMSEMDQYLKSQPAYQYTQGARDSAASLEQSILSTWGIT